MTAAIQAIYGVEPAREGEYPTAHIVGGKSFVVQGNADSRPFTVTKIERREENFGDHGLLWYDVFDGDRVVVSMQGRAVAEVHYGE